MRKPVIFLILIILGGIASAQIVNNAYIVNDAGVYIVCGADLKNDVNGNFKNNGNILLGGNFVNNFSFVSGGSSNVTLNGSTQDIGGTNPTTFNNLIIDGTGNKTLSVNSSVASSLVFNANKISIANNNLTLLYAATVSNAGNDKFVVTNGTGSLIKKAMPISANFLFPVGDDTSSYKPVTLNYTGTVDTFAVRAENGVNPTTGTDAYCVLKTWVINESNAGGTTATLNLGWNTVDQGASFLNNVALLWHNIGGTWSPINDTPGSASNSPATDWYHQTSGIIDFSAGSSRFILKAYLQPVIVLQPTNTSACNGGTLSFSCSASGIGLSYQWQENCGSGWNNLSDNTTYSGSTTNNLTISNAQTSGCQYQCIVTNPGGADTTVIAIATVNPTLPLTISIAASPAGPVCYGTPVTFTPNVANGGTTPGYQWNLNGTVVSTGSTYTSTTLTMGDHIQCVVTSNEQCVTGNPATSNTITMIVKPSLVAGLSITASDEDICSNTLVTFNAQATNPGTIPVYQWYVNSTVVGTNSNTYSSSTLNNGDLVYCQITSNEACIIGNPATSDTITMIVAQSPVAIAGSDVTYITAPVAIGSSSNGPGTISWLPTAGLDNPASATPNASPSVTTVYTITVTNNGCTATDDVIVNVHSYFIQGKTRYAGKANANTFGNFPTYNAVIYNIDRVIVIMKDLVGNELARDTSDASGNYQFADVVDGSYMLSYDKYTEDTMQWVNDVNAIDISLLKTFIGTDTLQDPSRCFSAKYKRAANVDNNSAINSVDVARIKAKIGAPYIPSINFPKGNWVALDTVVQVSGANLNAVLKTICYGDFNASSSRYRDSVTTWGMGKSLTKEMIQTSDEYMAITNKSFIEIPLKISEKVNDLAALGLELNYPSGDYKLVSAWMPGTKVKGSVKINPSFEEILTDNNDLLVTDFEGVIRVVYATTNYFNVSSGDDIIVLGFSTNKNLLPGELDFNLSGTGVVGNKYGEESEDAFLTRPRILVQGNETEAGFELAGYPNPFNDEANITYNIPENGSVKLNVYNAIGELVSELVNESQSAGKHTVIFAQHYLAAGMYTFRLEYTGTEKSECLLLKMVH